MIDLNIILAGLSDAFTLYNMLFVLFGVVLGQLVGALPGIGPVMAMANDRSMVFGKWTYSNAPHRLQRALLFSGSGCTRCSRSHSWQAIRVCVIATRHLQVIIVVFPERRRALNKGASATKCTATGTGNRIGSSPR